MKTPVVSRINVDSLPNPNDGNCNISPTTINGGKAVCGGIVIFEEHFDGELTNNWQKEVNIPIDSAVYSYSYYL